MIRWLLIAVAIVACRKSPEPAPAISSRSTSPSLADFAPATLGGVAPDPVSLASPPLLGSAVRRYRLRDGRIVDVALLTNPDVPLVKAMAARAALAPGEVRDDGDLAFKGFDVQGHTVVRAATWSGGTTVLGRQVEPRETLEMTSEVTLLLLDRVQVTIIVQQAKDPDDAITYLRTLDLAGIEAFARTLPPAPTAVPAQDAAGPDPG